MSECKNCIHYPICEWCAENTEFKFPEDNKKCAMWHDADVVPRAEIRNMFVELQTLIDEYLDGLYGTAEFIDIFHNLEKKFTEEK